MSLVLSEQSYLPATVTVYANVKPKAEPAQINCRSCWHAGMTACYFDRGVCVNGSKYAELPAVQFWKQP